ncbi:MAG: toll/interleukin-1 receptor domain-containing protein [Candidatus Hydrogenedentes bacterium]|nr:toll/interleukin-1 receptor domain-containing protein [Candidatus Hydrogenedentota bacterium]
MLREYGCNVVDNDLIGEKHRPCGVLFFNGQLKDGTSSSRKRAEGMEGRMSQDDSLQIVLQTEKSDGSFKCEGFSGIPVIHPCYIVLATDGTPRALRNALKLRDFIWEELQYLDPSVSSPYVPCGGAIPNPEKCHAHATDRCKKLLVLIGDGSATLPSASRFDHWMRRDDSYVALPVVPKAVIGRISKYLRPSFSASNAVYYVHDIREVVPAVLSSVGLTTDENRIFISYRRDDTLDLADQLFDALSHEGFEVFLDRFRVPPALNFQRRLTTELADKGMVLVLESRTFDQSEWTRYEIEFAVKHRLGLYAIQMPDGKDQAGIENGSRLRLGTTQLEPCGKVLDPNSLKDIVGIIKVEHGRKLVWRRRLMRESMCQALALEGMTTYRIGPTGVIHVTGGGSAKRDYSISLTPRPPVLRDFHDTYLQANSLTSSCGLVVGPLASQEPSNQERVYWLGDVSGVRCFDEGKMAELARALKGGAL